MLARRGALQRLEEHEDPNHAEQRRKINIIGAKDIWPAYRIGRKALSSGCQR
jgi:hypothetical protein